MSGKEGSGRPGEAPLQSAVWVDSGSSGGEASVGEPRLVKGGATVSAFTDERPAPEQEPGERGRIISEAEIAERGLLQERVIEIGEMREEAVVSRHAVVREELVVRKDVEERTERIAETVRRTEVEVEGLEDRSAGEEAEDLRAG